MTGAKVFILSDRKAINGALVQGPTERRSALLESSFPLLIMGQEAIEANPDPQKAPNVPKKNPQLRTDGIDLIRKDNQFSWPATTTEVTTSLLRNCFVDGGRWYMPTDFGQCIPEQAEFRIGKLDVCLLFILRSPLYWISWIEDGTGVDEFQARKMMTGRSTMPPTGHALGQYTKDLGKGIFNFPITSPETAQHIGDRSEKRYADGESFSLSMEDRSYNSDYPSFPFESA